MRAKPTHTPTRTVRVSDDLWQAAMRAANAEGRTLTDVVIASLNRLVRKHTKENAS